MNRNIKNSNMCVNILHATPVLVSAHLGHPSQKSLDTPLQVTLSSLHVSPLLSTVIQAS